MSEIEQSSPGNTNNPGNKEGTPGNPAGGAPTDVMFLGGFAIQDPIYSKFQALGSEKTANGTAVSTYLGDPLANQAQIEADQGGGTVQYFQCGMIVSGQSGVAFVVYGLIYARYRDLGGLSSGLGQPISDEQNAVRGGRVSSFDKGEIYWHSDHGAHEVHGAICDRYKALGGPGGDLGYPVTGETAIMRDKKNAGYFNRFANNGAIYWSQATGAWEVCGEIRKAWEDQYKGVNGSLGFPIAEQKTIAAVKSNNLPETIHGSFQTGTLVWHDSGPHAGTNCHRSRYLC